MASREHFGVGYWVGHSTGNHCNMEEEMDRVGTVYIPMGLMSALSDRYVEPRHAHEQREYLVFCSDACVKAWDKDECMEHSRMDEVD
jgi:hypothetical protein